MIMYFPLNKKHIIIRTLVKLKNEKKNTEEQEDLVRYSLRIHKVHKYLDVCC